MHQATRIYQWPNYYFFPFFLCSMARQCKAYVRDRFLGQATGLYSHVTLANKIVKEKLTSTQYDLFKKIVFSRFY